MEAATVADPSADTIDVALTVPTAPTSSTATTMAISKPKAKVKKELTMQRGKSKTKSNCTPGSRAGKEG
jgi:hypothetical protein